MQTYLACRFDVPSNRHRARRHEFGQFRYINRDWIAYLIAHDVRNGSKPDERGHRPGGPHLGVKQTKSGAKQTLPLEGRLSGVERSYQRRGPNRRL